jgi:hypothetical protein
MIPPVVVSRLEHGGLNGLGIGVISVGCGLIAGGMAAAVAGFRRARGITMPSGVRAAVTANVLFLAFFALELSDRLVRRDGRIGYWSTFLLLPAFALFCGLLAARAWAWWVSRGAAGLAALWFLGFVAMIPFAKLQTDGVPVPWYGRVYMACISLMFAGILVGASRSLGRPETRSYFGLIRSIGDADA